MCSYYTVYCGLMLPFEGNVTELQLSLILANGGVFCEFQDIGESHDFTYVFSWPSRG